MITCTFCSSFVILDDDKGAGALSGDAGVYFSNGISAPCIPRGLVWTLFQRKEAKDFYHSLQSVFGSMEGCLRKLRQIKDGVEAHKEGELAYAT